ncbi:Rha family transcriptional regulator [Bacillus sp. JJ722]|uniref:Rha family transcriptional regulator n=1 Tax=Bacillus sp. JJ722 TaxID=3122973 RepID=UPI002FFD6C39
MNQLVFVENGQAVTDSLTIAEMFGKNHKDVLRDIRTQMGYAGEEFTQRNFAPGSYLDKNNQERPKESLTEEAFTLVVFSYNTKEAVQTKIKFIQEFKRMREKLSKPPMLSEHEQRVELLKLSLEHEQKLNNVEDRVEKLETEVKERITLESGEQRRLQLAVAEKVYSITHDKKEATKLFRELYRELKNRFAVSSYKDIKSHELEAAITYVSGWIPRKIA